MRHGGPGCEFKAKRTRRLPAVAAPEADAEIGRPAGRSAAAYARAAAGGGGGSRRDRRRLVHPARAGAVRQSFRRHDRRAGAGAAAFEGRTPASEGADANHRPPRFCPRNRSTGDPACGRTAQPARLCHGTALGHSRLERGRRRHLCVQPVGRGRSQQPALGADQPRHTAAVRRVMGGGGQAHGGAVPRHARPVGGRSGLSRPAGAVAGRVSGVYGLVGGARCRRHGRGPEIPEPPQEGPAQAGICEFSGQRRSGAETRYLYRGLIPPDAARQPTPLKRAGWCFFVRRPHEGTLGEPENQIDIAGRIGCAKLA